MRRYIGLGIVVLCIWIFAAQRLMQRAAQDSAGHSRSSIADASAGGEGSSNEPAKFSGPGNEADYNESLALYRESFQLLQQKQYSQAFKLDEQAVAKYPYNPHIYNQMAILCFQSGRPSDVANGVEFERKAISLKQDSCDYWNNLAKGLGMQNNIQDARSAFENALQCNPTEEQSAEIQQNIAVIDKALQSAQQ